MPLILLSLICFAASCIGAVVGAGGGVIIKPVLDLLGLLPVSTASFCSGCTVLAMAAFSLICTRKNNLKLKLETTLPLAIGAILGGYIGKRLFELVRQAFSNENTLGAIQASILTIITAGVLLYVCKKDKLPSLNVKSAVVSVIIGAILGIISTFLGIGGGTSNVAVLFFFFSMDAKEAAQNSLFIIVLSQLANIINSVVSGTVPDINNIMILPLMTLGGVGGAFVGAKISKRLSGKNVETVLKGLLVCIICIDFYNAIKFIIFS